MEFSASGDSTIVKVDIQHESLEDLEKIMEMGFREGFSMALENFLEQKKQDQAPEK